MSNIYKIETEYRDIISVLVENGGELTPEIEQALQINQKDLYRKSESYAYAIKELDGEIDIIKSETGRAQAMKTARDTGKNQFIVESLFVKGGTETTDGKQIFKAGIFATPHAREKARIMETGTDGQRAQLARQEITAQRTRETQRIIDTAQARETAKTQRINSPIIWDTDTDKNKIIIDSLKATWHTTRYILSVSGNTKLLPI